MGNPSQVIGLIGTGQIGLPIAVNLISAGYRVVGMRRHNCDPFVRHGGEVLDSLAEVARVSDYVLLCLPGEEAELEVLDGEDGILDVLGPGKIVIELGTYRRNFKLAQAKRIEARGAEMLEAEISGSPPMVAERRAALYIGGSAALHERCKPVLEAITEHHFHIGELGCAVGMKLIANYLLTIHTLAAAEAMNLGTRAGYDPHLVAEVIRQGAGNSAMFTIRAPLMAARKFSPPLGQFNTLEKYLRMGEEFARELGCATPLFSTAAPYFLHAIEDGMGVEDIAAVIKLIEAESGPTSNSISKDAK